ncbi:hypothetical protein ACLKA7_010889 [Drosophila subpalustris]
MIYKRADVKKVRQIGYGQYMRLLPATAATTAAAPECFSMLARSNNSNNSSNSSNSCISNILSQIHMVLIAMTAATLLALALRDGNTLLLLLWLPLLLLGILSKLPIGSQQQQQQQQQQSVNLTINSTTAGNSRIERLITSEDTSHQDEQQRHGGRGHLLHLGAAGGVHSDHHSGWPAV